MTRKTLTSVLAALVLATFAPSALAVGADADRSAAQRKALSSYGSDVNIVMGENDVPSYLMGRLSALASGEPREAAEAALDQHGAAFRRGPNDGFAFRVAEHDQLGMSHVRMTQTYAGLPVVGGELIVHLAADAVAGINGRFVADLDLDTHVTVADRHAASAALAYVESLGGRFGAVRNIEEPVIFALEDAARLAVPVLVEYVTDNGPQVDMVYVDGRSGVALARYSRVYTAKFRKIYNLNQACISTGNEMPGTLMFQEGGSSADSAAMGAYNGTGTTYDYYKNVHNRDSYDNAGANIVSSIHGAFSSGVSCSKNNAAWFDSPYNQMAYGDGDGSTFTNLANGLDVTAHELSHAVCSRTANLVYQKESGALNEANSDIMGRTAAFWSGQGNAATRTDWAIGADVYTPGTSGDALRYMYNPTADGYSKDYYPTRLYSGTCTPSQSNDECGVHGNSGIANLFYYLLSQGGTHPRGVTTVNVPAIGITNARAIWYRALANYMTSSTNFQGARTATASAAADLFGGSCSATWQSVQKGWDAVGVPGTWSCGGTNDFSVALTPTSRTTAQGTTTTFTVTTAVVSGTPGTISLSVSGLPAGVTGSFSPASVAAGSSSTLTLTVSGSAAAATTSFTVTGTATVSHTATGSITVTSTTGAFPESAHPYVNNYDNTWTYTLTGAPASINVTFDAQTKVETNYDYIYVMDKNGVNIAGSPFTSTTLAGVTKNVPGDTVKIRLKTDVSVVYYGFKVTAVTAGGGGGDTTLPTVSISSPASGATITGSTTVSATASDNVGVTKVEFYLDGALQATDTTSPYGWVWSPTSAQNGGHSLTAKAYDAAGNTKTSTAVSVTVSISSSCTPQQLIANGGFETGSASPWTASAGVIDSSASEPSHSGTYKAWMDGYGSAHTDTLSQSVSIPACATTATLTFWLHIDTAETGSTAYDVLTVKAGSTTLATYSNANAAAGYVQKSLNVIAFKGQTVSINFTAVEDASLQTSFVIDDAALNTQ